MIGYAAFVERYRDDEDFRHWFAPVDAAWSSSSTGDNRRLVAIQHALVALIDELDPKRKYTAGYDLEPIEPDTVMAPGTPWTPEPPDQAGA